MKKYILLRTIKSIISIFIVVAIVVAMVYTMIPENNIFKGDTQFQKLKGNQKTVYKYDVLEKLGYIDFLTIGEMCNLDSTKAEQCLVKDSPTQKEVLSKLEKKGYKVEVLDGSGDLNGQIVATRHYNVFELVGGYFRNMLIFDNPNKIQDKNNPKLDGNRGYYFGKDHNGMPALMCLGCEYKYQVYLNGSFPFIHGNFMKLSFGTSYPTSAGIPTLDVITGGQGSLKNSKITYPTGITKMGSEDLHSLKYKKSLNNLDVKKYNDNYADAKRNYQSPSMVSVSYMFGVLALVFAYLIAIPFGIAMARNKGKLTDKLGIVYINILIAIPSLAFIYIVKYLGNFISLPDKFPQLGFTDVRSYILPVVILTVLSTPGLMTWVRRYMIDQSSADYVKFAKAKGLTNKEISVNHIFKNAIIPIVNGIPASIVLAISGAVITETVFAIPGMGKMLPDAIKASNNNMVITLTFIFTTLSIFSLFAGDILLTIIDPRISLNAKKGDL